jgi:hypothetical protein
VLAALFVVIAAGTQGLATPQKESRTANERTRHPDAIFAVARNGGRDPPAADSLQAVGIDALGLSRARDPSQREEKDLPAGSTHTPTELRAISRSSGFDESATCDRPGGDAQSPPACPSTTAIAGATAADRAAVAHAIVKVSVLTT